MLGSAGDVTGLRIAHLIELDGPAGAERVVVHIATALHGPERPTWLSSRPTGKAGSFESSQDRAWRSITFTWSGLSHRRARDPLEKP